MISNKQVATRTSTLTRVDLDAAAVAAAAADAHDDHHDQKRTLRTVNEEDAGRNITGVEKRKK